MFKQRKLNGFQPSYGPVTVMVSSGYALQGSFSLSLTDGDQVITAGGGKFGDNIPDIFILPVPGNKISAFTLIIVGTYAAAFGHDQVDVEYAFYQMGAKFDSERIQQNTTGLSAHHNFDFE